MNKKTPEGIIVKAIAQYLELRERKGDCFFFRVRNMSFNARAGTFIKAGHGPLMKNGIPDIVGVYKSLWVGLEVKANTKQSDTQKQFEASVKKSGGYYFVVRSIDDVIRALAEVDLVCGLHSAFREIISEEKAA